MNTHIIISAVLTALSVSLLAYLVADGIQFTRAIHRARKAGRLTEWFEQPRRMWPGSGFLLFRKFR